MNFAAEVFNKMRKENPEYKLTHP